MRQFTERVLFLRVTNGVCAPLHRSQSSHSAAGPAQLPPLEQTELAPPPPDPGLDTSGELPARVSACGAPAGRAVTSGLITLFLRLTSLTSTIQGCSVRCAIVYTGGN